ncbi:hypothetical protein CYMTET_28273 [Cymbomonas tetramitiformis]|uniref:Multicopper oxidase n=1 Tax=Cymbomonas tetramitiformis TaxID=36881 RepID=A0AAE0FPN6_9CHLO|nr:hypothetical protein CYMTET_28273 [Cymbomonas tetramitiformis]
MFGSVRLACWQTCLLYLGTTSVKGQVNYGATGAALQQPTEYASTNGVLELTLTMAEFAYSGPTASFITRAINDAIPSPTWRVKPGDQIRITYLNALGPNPEGQDTTMNTYHSPNTTNLHTHGLHISSATPGDNVFDHLEPSATFGTPTSRSYVYDIPLDHAGGTHWYHPHVHGSTALQVGGGAAGCIIVEDEAGDVPLSVANMETELLFMQYFPLSTGPTLRQISRDMDDELIRRSLTGDADFVLVNGQYLPEVTMTAGVYKRFRIVHSGTIAFLELGLSGCTLDLLGKDGIYLRSVPRRISTINVVAGSRADVAIKCDAVGSYLMQSGARRRRRRQLLQAGSLFTGSIATFTVVSNSGASSDNLETFTPVFPDYLADLQNVDADNTFTLQFRGGGGGCTINDLSFPGHDESDALHTMPVGTVEEWTVSGLGGHPWHLHINPYQLVMVNDASETGYLAVGDWHDVLYNTDGRTIVRFQTDRFTGQKVIHCHFLPHEDQGCMATTMITGTEGTPGRSFSTTTAHHHPLHPPTPSLPQAHPLHPLLQLQAHLQKHVSTSVIARHLPLRLLHPHPFHLHLHHLLPPKSTTSDPHRLDRHRPLRTLPISAFPTSPTTNPTTTLTVSHLRHHRHLRSTKSLLPRLPLPVVSSAVTVPHPHHPSSSAFTPHHPPPLPPPCPSPPPPSPSASSPPLHHLPTAQTICTPTLTTTFSTSAKSTFSTITAPASCIVPWGLLPPPPSPPPYPRLSLLRPSPSPPPAPPPPPDRAFGVLLQEAVYFTIRFADLLASELTDSDIEEYERVVHDHARSVHVLTESHKEDWDGHVLYARVHDIREGSAVFNTSVTSLSALNLPVGYASRDLATQKEPYIGFQAPRTACYRIAGTEMYWAGFDKAHAKQSYGSEGHGS